MGVTVNKGTAITNRDAVPAVLNNSNNQGGMLREVNAKFAIATSDSISSSYRLCQIPSNARISQVLLACEAAGTAGALNVGLYETTANGGAAVDSTLIAANQSIGSKLSNTDITHQSASFNFDETEKMLWDLIGLSSDPKKDYDLVAWVNVIVPAATKCTLKVRYAV